MSIILGAGLLAMAAGLVDRVDLIASKQAPTTARSVWWTVLI
ncbi:hypothetical protein [Pseudomonas mandelii]|nr:hypothetical protein [Pseudomonas mandelii]MCX2898921.1 hypothetical protein [Pseudomonas mandelii]